MKHIILASASPRRKELLQQIGIDFSVVSSNAEEIITQTEPGLIVEELSRLKAEAVCRTSLNQEELQKSTVIGADTIVYYNGEVLGKPKDEKDAKRMLEQLSGNVHQVYTGVTLILNQTHLSFYEKTDVCVYEMTTQEIMDYIATGEPMDKAGAYGIQGKFAAFIKYIDGDYNNVVGLPVARLYHELRKAELD
jgi:septum formation protein